jgi:hypothetical protein
MRASKPGAWVALAFLALLASPLAAWQDPFDAWSASAYLQFLEINRPTGGLPPTGSLDAYGDAADGYTRDGLWFRNLDLSLSGPLGWPGFSAVLASHVYLSTPDLTDFYAQWAGAFGRLRMGQEYLPFGVEQQTSFKDLPGIQRSLAYGFENYGHAQPWGLQLMDQRGWGLRWDAVRAMGPLDWTASAGLQDFSGGTLYRNALGGIGRLALDWRRGPFSAGAGYSALLARGQILTPPLEFTPLGAPQGAAEEASADISGHAFVKTWGPDVQADAGPLHGRAEMALQSLDGLSRGGGQATVSLDLDGALARLGAPLPWRRAYVYAEWEQALSGFGDGVHRAGALYRADTYGLRLPTLWRPASLKLEYLRVGCDAFGGTLPDGDIYQAQLQFEL